MSELRMEVILEYIGLLGSFALAISGSLKAMDKQFDPFGVFIIAFVTAVGGGTIRDILIEKREVFWFSSPQYLYYIIAGTVLAIIFRRQANKAKRTLMVFDTVGLGLFTVTGVQIGLSFGLDTVTCLILGTMTGSFGGVIRDILVNEVPVIFHKEVYATICIAGGAIYIALYRYGMENPYLQLIPIFFIILARFVVVYFKITLPSIYGK